MKRWIGFPLLLVLGLTACELLLAPKQPRDNPNDPDNPVIPAHDFHAVGSSEAEVTLSFFAPVTEETEKMPSGYVIVRAEGKPPGNMEDGVQVATGTDFEAGKMVTHIDGSGLSSGNQYGYSLWVHGSDEYEDHFTYSGSNTAFAESPPSFSKIMFGNLRAFGIADEAVRVDWWYDETSFVPPSHFVVRKEGFDPPADPYEGKGFPVMYDWSFEEWGLEQDTEYTYAVFAADEDGSPYPPKSGSAVANDTATTINASDRLVATQDAYIDEDGGKYGYDTILAVRSEYPAAYSFVNFDPVAIGDLGYVTQARLILKTVTVPQQGSIEVRLIHRDWWWDEGSLPSTGDIYGGFTADDGYYASNHVDQSGMSYTWDVTPFFDRIMEEGALNGFVLAAGENPDGVAVSFYSRDDVLGNEAVLEVDYYVDYKAGAAP